MSDSVVERQLQRGRGKKKKGGLNFYIVYARKRKKEQRGEVPPFARNKGHVKTEGIIFAL